MKKLSDYIKEEIAVSIGTEAANSTYATPGNTTGMGNPKPPTVEEPGSGDLLGKTTKKKKKKA
jgi:hypothetical protein